MIFRDQSVLDSVERSPGETHASARQVDDQEFLAVVAVIAFAFSRRVRVQA